jgi:hypothetical protein
MKTERTCMALAALALATFALCQCGSGGSGSDANLRKDVAVSMADGPAPVRPGESTDARRDAPPSCPAARPQNGARCAVDDDCTYDKTLCICLDPGPTGAWQCGGSAPTDAMNRAGCPREIPDPEDPCPEAGAIDECRYDDLVCSCVPKEGWECLI